VHFPDYGHIVLPSLLMKIIFTLAFSVFINSLLLSQPLSKSQAQQYADALLQAEMLSSEGHQELVRLIDHKPTKLQQFYEKNVSLGGGFIIEADTFLVTKSTLLGFFMYVERLESMNHSFLMEKQKAKELTEKCQKLKGRKWNVRLLANPPKGLNSSSYLDELTAEKIQSLQEYYRRMTNILHQIQLLDEKVYQDVTQWVDQAAFSKEEQFHFFDYIGQRTFFYEEYEFNKKEQLLYLDSLRIRNVISEENYGRLLTSYQPYQLKSALDILPYCQKATVVETTQLPQESLAAFKQVLTQIQATILPSLSLETLTTFQETHKDEEYGGEYSQTLVSALLNGKEYQQTLRFDPTGFQFRSSEDFIVGRVHGNEFQIVEDFLADQKDTAYLYLLDDKNHFTLSVGTRLGLILLDSVQADLLTHFAPLSALPSTSLLSHRLTFNREGIRKIIREYQQLGLAPTLSDSEMEKVIVQSRRDGFCSYQRILSNLPNLIADTDPHLPVEELIQKGPKATYLTILEKLSQVSHQHFVPRQSFLEKLPTRKKGENKLRFGFTFQNRTYQGVLEEESYLYFSSLSDNQVVKLVNKALAEQKVDGRYYPLVLSNQFLFLNQQQYQYLRTHQPSLFESAYRP
jgi:hypothetical protein